MLLAGSPMECVIARSFAGPFLPWRRPVKFASPRRTSRICVRAAKKGSSSGSAPSQPQQSASFSTHQQPAPSWAAGSGEETVTQEWAAPPPSAYYPPGYQQSQAYTTLPQYPVLPAPEPAKAAGWNLPWYLWVGVGFLLANVLAKVMNLTQQAPANMQQMMMDQMMKQMMNQMGTQGGPGQPNPFGASPFGVPSSSPFGAPSSSPFGAPSSSPFGGPGSNPYNPPSSASTTTSSTRTTQKSTSGFPPLPPTIDVTPNPPSSSPPPSTSTQQPEQQQNPFFTDAAEAPFSNGSNSGGSSSWSSQSSFFQDTDAQSGAEGGGEGDAARGSSLLDSMEFMLTDPRMQQMLLPYLPEAMRNPDTITTMLKDPVMRKQMEKSLEAMEGNFPTETLKSMQSMMGGPMNLDNPEYRKQFEAVGTTPEQVMQKMMSDPDLMRSIQNPRVMKAVMEVSNNPLAIVNYKDDQEVYTVLNRMQQLLSPGP